MKLETYTRKELENLSLNELKQLLDKYMGKPLGNTAYKVAYTNALSLFDKQAIRECESNIGICCNTESVIKLERLISDMQALIHSIENPTNAQKMLIVAGSIHDEWCNDPIAQERMIARFMVKQALIECVKKIVKYRCTI